MLLTFGMDLDGSAWTLDAAAIQAACRGPVLATLIHFPILGKVMEVGATQTLKPQLGEPT
jgi:hypothetical protein